MKNWEGELLNLINESSEALKLYFKEESDSKRDEIFMDLPSSTSTDSKMVLTESAYEMTLGELLETIEIK
jgi:hypothetical protein